MKNATIDEEEGGRDKDEDKKEEEFSAGIYFEISVILFLYFNLNQKAIELNNVGHINFFLKVFSIYKNLHIEPFKSSIKKSPPFYRF